MIRHWAAAAAVLAFTSIHPVHAQDAPAQDGPSRNPPRPAAPAEGAPAPAEPESPAREPVQPIPEGPRAAGVVKDFTPPAPIAPQLAAPADKDIAPAAPEGPQDATVAVSDADDNLLYGSYLRPEGLDSYPAVLILPAQGADRDGNAGQDVKPNTYRLLARDLAAKGVASVRIDKRGVGASKKALAREDDLRFDAYVADAVTWAKFLQAQPHVRCVAILGHSEGALAAALAAKQVKVCAIIEMSGAGRPAAAVLAEQLKTAADAGRMDKDDYAEASRILDSLAQGKAVRDPPAKLNALFRPSVQPFLISWLGLDPLEPLRTSTPVLILQGSTDFQAIPGDAQRLAAQPKTAKLVVIPGADHDLKVSPTDAKIRDGVDVRVVSPEASTAIAEFLKRVK